MTNVTFRTCLLSFKKLEHELNYNFPVKITLAQEIPKPFHHSNLEKINDIQKKKYKLNWINLKLHGSACSMADTFKLVKRKQMSC